MALRKFYIKIGDQGMDVVVALNLEAKPRGKGQIFWLYGVKIHILH